MGARLVLRLPLTHVHNYCWGCNQFTWAASFLPRPRSHPRFGWWWELPLGSFRPITEGLLKTNPKHHHDPVFGGACHLFCLVYVYYHLRSIITSVFLSVNLPAYLSLYLSLSIIFLNMCINFYKYTLVYLSLSLFISISIQLSDMYENKDKQHNS